MGVILTQDNVVGINSLQDMGGKMAEGKDIKSQIVEIDKEFIELGKAKSITVEAINQNQKQLTEINTRLLRLEGAWNLLQSMYPTECKEYVEAKNKQAQVGKPTKEIVGKAGKAKVA